MTKRSANGLGRFSVEVHIANNDDLAAVRRGTLVPEKVRRVTIPGVVDSGANRLVLPRAVVKQLGCPPGHDVQVKYADGRTGTRATVGQVHVEIQGRDDVFSAVVEPRRQSALVGAIVRETLDFVVDCTGQRLVPRDPRFIVNEIE
jgi:predicted aspartyl protease